MDWIERLFHISPDAGNGSLELSIMIGALIAFVMVLVGVVKVIPAVRSRLDRARSHRSGKLTPKHME
jgi:hypothetical protein